MDLIEIPTRPEHGPTGLEDGVKKPLHGSKSAGSGIKLAENRREQG